MTYDLHQGDIGGVWLSFDVGKFDYQLYFFIYVLSSLEWREID